MPRPLRSRLTYANVASSVALFLALGGGAAWAANQFTGADIRDETLTGADVKGNATTDGSLTGRDIRDGTVTNADLRRSSLTGGRLADGSVTGADVDESSLAGVLTTTLATYRVNVTETVGTDLGELVTAACDAGDRVASGGYVNLSANARVEDSVGDLDRWTVEVRGTNSGQKVTARVTCYDLPPAH